MRSMTGFGEAVREEGGIRTRATARSVNHRNLDLAVRLREEHRGLEAAIRERVAAAVRRGHVELAVELERTGDCPVAVRVQREVVLGLHAAVRELADAGLVAGELTVRDLLAVREALRVESEEGSWSEDEYAFALGTVEQALAALAGARDVEGRKLEAMLADRVAELERLAVAIGERRREALPEIHAALRRRIAELVAEVAVPEERVAQEAAILADRSDVREELDRLRAHLEHFRETMAGADHQGAIGKRLDFLTQEIFRELNTLGSKSRDAATTRLVVDAKVVCEQLREQVQNVE